MLKMTILSPNFLNMNDSCFKVCIAPVFLFPVGFFILSEFLSLMVFWHVVLPPGESGNFGLSDIICKALDSVIFLWRGPSFASGKYLGKGRLAHLNEISDWRDSKLGFGLYNEGW